MKKTILVLILCFSFVAQSCLSTNLQTKQKTNDNEAHEVEIPEINNSTGKPHEGSSTIMPNPKFDGSKLPITKEDIVEQFVDLDEYDVLVLEDDHSLSGIEHFDLAKSLPFDVIFTARDHDQSIVVVAATPYENCLLFHQDLETNLTRCLDTNSEILYQPQLDGDNNIYYVRKSETGNELVALNSDTFSKIILMTDIPEQHLIHQNGTAYWIDSEQNLLSLSDGVKSYVSYDLGDVSTFKFLSENLIYILKNTGANYIVNLTTGLKTIIYSDSNFSDFQSTQSGDVYMHDGTSLYEHTTSGPEKIDLSLSQVNSFRIFGNIILVIGKIESKQTLVIYDLEKDTFNYIFKASGNETIQEATVSKGTVYFETVLEYSNNSELYALPLADRSSFPILIEELRDPILKWQSLDKGFNGSFIEELNHSFSNPFIPVRNN